MKGRIKREDLDHLLRLVQSGLPEKIASGDTGEDDGGLSAAQHIFAPDQALWSANHAFWIEKLKSDTGGTWTDAQYAAAASIINAAEYQHVIFSDIASALTRGLSQGWRSHAPVGEDEFDFFSSKADRIGPSSFDETVDLVDGSTGQVRQVRLAAVLEDVRRPDRADERKGDGADWKGRPAADEFRSAADVVLSPKHVNLGELTGCRTRDAVPVPFNQARGELFAQCGLSTLLPYAGWDDFQDRNHLSEDLIADLKAAYPEGFAAVDLWVGGLAETPAVGDLGPTIAAAVSAEIARVQEGSAQSYLGHLAETHLLSEISRQTLSDIVARNAGAADLAHHLLASADQAIENGSPHIILGTEGNDVLVGTDGNDVIFSGAGDDFLDGRHGADVMAGGAGNDTYVVDDIRDRVIEKVDEGVEDTILTDLKSFALDDDAPLAGALVSNDSSSPPVLEEAASTSAISLAPTSDETSDDASEVNSILADFGRGANVENLTYTGDGSFSGIGNSSNNVLSGGRSNDKLWGGGGDDVLYGSDGDDTLDGGSGNDALFGGIGDDRFDGGGGDDVLYVSSRGPGYGHDTIVLRPGFGSDVVIGFDANESCSKGHDRLDVSAYASLTADSIGAEIQIIASGPHTIITINGDSLTLLDVNANAIGKDDFIFS